jgi:hypothetical protein
VLKNISRLKVEIDGKEHIYICDQDTPLTEAKEALFRFLNFIAQIEESANQNASSVLQENTSECKEKITCP